MAEYSKFDRFDARSYAAAYQADRVYELLGELLDRYLEEGMTVADLGSGASVPVAVWAAANRRRVDLHLFEPSRMADPADKLVRELPGGPYHLHRRAAHRLLESLPNGFDLLVCNRMLHEWRLVELERTGTWDLPVVFNAACAGLRAAGVVVMGDFAFPAELSERRVAASMAAMLRRFGHTHPPEHFIQPEDAAAALESSGLEILERHRIERPELDTDRFYWFLVARRMGGPQ